ncbi:bifunctional glutamate N-acetyltransferase/amino-acid acetyltransferase ArgJ [Nocardia jinanensis]|uniref:Arginine biosynthesis bifunctional protein ArgJ n=1 Tax=Nocardia jinanensis TaxID=382504 RepID=A0A917RK68_9NOCA|nr:bifunctional glutamate N-acetyltransferase/amino-acid acetyltransferase ArgJ [Nocardia jinanensis]GGL10853.1 arginine biosynthesis bifunctional protein ArgJ [Nocardia jinanensis]
MSAENLVPQGFRSVTARLGLKEESDDFALAFSEVPARSAAVFTRSRFAGPSVILSRDAARGGELRGMVAISRNANVATGEAGSADATEVRERAAVIAGVEPAQLLIASTGVIGIPYPMPTVRAGLAALGREARSLDPGAVAAAIMTTDTHPKTAQRRCGDAVIAGVAKGVGMMEPNMATLLTFFFTDALVPGPELDAIFRRVVDKTFNALSIDTDTSTSDTAAVFANGLAGPVDLAEFEQSLYQVALDLVRAIAADGEGATKLIEVHVTGARDTAQAKRAAKVVVNSPLVKTAVHGADPNWGRVAMALGKLEGDVDIDPARVQIGFDDLVLYPRDQSENLLGRARRCLEKDTVLISVDLGIGTGTFTAYGCDLTEGYVRLNADYTT